MRPKHPAQKKINPKKVLTGLGRMGRMKTRKMRPPSRGRCFRARGSSPASALRRKPSERSRRSGLRPDRRKFLWLHPPPRAPVIDPLAHFKVQGSYASDNAAAMMLVAEILADARGGLIAVDFETAPIASERARLRYIGPQPRRGRGRKRALRSSEDGEELRLAKAGSLGADEGGGTCRARRSRSAPGRSSPRPDLRWRQARRGPRHA